MKKNKLIIFLVLALAFALLLSFSVGATAEKELLSGEGEGTQKTSILGQPLSFLSKLANRDFHVVYLVIFSLCAIVICFYGYGLLRYSLGLFTFGGAIYLSYFAATQLELFVYGRARAMVILVSVLVGIVLSALAFCMTKLGAFLFVSIFSYLILSTLGNASSVFAFFSIALGIIASLFVRVSVVALSSLVGGMILGASLLGITKIVAFPFAYIPLGLIFTVLGMTIQFSFARTKKEKKRQRREKHDEEYGEEDAE